MMVGSYGSLGVIVRARLSLADLPTTRATALLALETDQAVSDCLRHLRPALGESLLAFELISGEAMRMTLASSIGIPRPFGDREHACYVLIEIGSDARSDLDATLADVLDHLVETNPGIMSDAVIAPPPDLWRLRHSLTEGTKGPGSTLRFDIGMSPAHLSELRRRLAEELSGPGAPTISEFGHWADGGTHLQLIYQSILSPRQEERARQVVYDVVVGEFAGSFSAEHGLGPFNASFYERYIPPAERRLDRRLKSAFDPRGVWGREPLS
jgi:FAD/FMN-containing dehydrogenase